MYILFIKINLGKNWILKSLGTVPLTYSHKELLVQLLLCIQFELNGLVILSKGLLKPQLNRH